MENHLNDIFISTKWLVVIPAIHTLKVFGFESHHTHRKI